ncbi:hypothetical protein CDD83_6543 [Cordyceps sp. RAO-2017]|nr:hypothetical protein CDD83_6543 [Cordyceps sp. RAO-2017]
MASLSLRCAAVVVAALGIQAAVAGVAQPARNHNSCRKTTVAVLGAGISGITAAQALHNASISDFVILEYQNRIGGRAHHTDFGAKPDGSPYTVELGANWIQGLGKPGGPQNPIYILAEKHKLKNTFSDYKSILSYNETGYTDYTDLLDEYEAASKRASAAAGRLLLENLQDQSARTGLALAGWNPSHGDMAAQAVEYWSWDWEAAFPPEQSSLIFGMASDNLTFHQYGEQNNFVTDQRGFSAIIEGEARSFLRPGDGRLLLDKQITEIAHSESGVTVHASDGSCVSAAYAICSFSLGVLQGSGVRFTPPLPRWKETAIQKFAMGTYTKIFYQFNETFWPRDKQYFLYASPTTRGHFAVWQSLDADGFLPGSHILFATVTHDESYRLERQSDEATKQEGLRVLRAMFPDRAVPEPTAFLYPRWTDEPWARGSYSNWPVGTTLEMHQNLRANVGRLWFAGEALSAQYFGFLHGAWVEGHDAGAQVAGHVDGGRCVDVYAGREPVCGDRVHYPHLRGTSPLENYDLLHGWAKSSFIESQARSIG